MLAGRESGGQATWSVTALTKEEIVPIEHDGVRYRINVFIDRYLPGQCNWSLKRNDYRMHAEGADYDFGEGDIHILEQKDLDEWRHSQPPYQGRQDIWCGRATNRAVRPYTPVFCHRINQLFEHVSEAVQASVPKEEIEPHGSVYATPETTSIEFNFHDFDHCVMHDYGRLLSLTAAPDCPRL